MLATQNAVQKLECCIKQSLDNCQYNNKDKPWWQLTTTSGFIFVMCDFHANEFFTIQLKAKNTWKLEKIG